MNGDAPSAMRPRIVFLTAGAAGMYCGSCMHDNEVAKALIQEGVDCLLQPVYTPIRTDGSSVADEQVFFGGIDVYLAQKFPWARKLPGSIRRLINSPALIRLATRKTGSTEPKLLGQLTTSMLRGENGNQSHEVKRLVTWLQHEMKPDAVVLSNLLIGGAIPALRRALPQTKIAVMLQGDDIFLDHLPAADRDESITLCRSLVDSVDFFITHSQFYADKMGTLLQIPTQKRIQFPLTIDTDLFAAKTKPAPVPSANPDRVAPSDSATRSIFRLGYLARIAPEKGLHNLVDAFLSLADWEHVQLHVAGWLGDHHRSYFQELKTKIHHAGLADRFVYHGSPSLNEKVSLLQSWDAVCVPTDYHEPKGLFVLESLAAGTPVIQPDHGAFGELIQSTGGGVIYPPGDAAALVHAIRRMVEDDEHRSQLAQRGRAGVLEKHRVQQTAQRLKALLIDPDCGAA